ncbi:MAG TPA: serine protease [Cyanobacteria bacterium UBA11370]|nr:serine protease [Cyanobacteria bacterium UBA11370]HBY76373.1 serine protease [Cyanobacteria bacterium UBA11148]
MKIYDQLPAILAGTAIVSAIVITLPQTAMALSGEQVNDIAREVTVLIKGNQGHGSGAIVSRSGNTYYVLTAYHVVSSQDEYKIITHDKKAYQLSNIKRLPGVDLAVVEFTSDEEYQTAKLANSDMVTEGKPVFVSGWPRLTTVGNAAGGQLVRQFTDGRVSGFLPQPLHGYKMIYTNTTLAGMSGGPVLDAGGRIVGIHGLGDTEDPTRLQQEGLSEEAASSIAGLIKPGFNYAIPINTFLQGAPQAGLFLGLQVENSSAPELGAPYVASAEPDPRDTIDDINRVLNTIDRVRTLGCRFGICF